MERRRMAVVLAGLVLVGGGVIALRLGGGTAHEAVPPPPPPVPTSVKPFSAEGVLAPTPDHRPGAPIGLRVIPGPRRLQLRWGSAVPQALDPVGAVGYDVRWGIGPVLDHDLLVVEPFAELDDLRPNQQVRVQVRTVDQFGQRSTPVTTTGAAQSDAAAGPDNALVDDFAGDQVPDPTHWELGNQCAQASGGAANDRLVVLNNCGQSSATLRSRVPFLLRPRAGALHGELGRFTIDTDSPGEDGEMDIDLVPGPVTMIDGSSNDSLVTTKPGTAAVDGDLPPGTIRVRIVANVDPDSDAPTDVVQVSAGPHTPTVPIAARTLHPIPRPYIGMSVRWDVVLRTDGVEVLRNGVLVAGANVVPTWTTATPLIEFGGPSLDQQRDDVSMVGYGGAPTKTPPLIAAPGLLAGGFPIVTPGASAKAITSKDDGPGSGLLRMTVLASPNNPTALVTVNGRDPKFAVKLGDRTYTLVPAVPGTPLLAGVRYPLVARIPASALTGQQDLPVNLVADAPASYPDQLTVDSIDLDITPGPGTEAVTSRVAGPGLTTTPPQLAAISTDVLNASGNVPTSGKPLPRGRAVLEVTMDGAGTQRATGQLAGLAGFEVWLDNVELVAVSTDKDGPGIAGTWQIAFDTGSQSAGPHNIDVRAYSTQRGPSFGETFTSYQLGQ
ncbi:MAG TPA: fibronectin type III domain-containing protein [Pseudonocardiaceae bacterium]